MSGIRAQTVLEDGGIRSWMGPTIDSPFTSLLSEVKRRRHG